MSGRRLVFAAVGTDVHSFDRLVEWMDAWALAYGGPDVECLVQYGTSRPPAVCDGVAYLEHEALRATLERASVVVCHGGPATIAEARECGQVPVCVPRDDRKGEHVDSHQRRFARRIAQDRIVVLVEEQRAFHDVLRLALSDPGRLALQDPQQRRLRPVIDHVGLLISELVGSRR